jgi:AbiU2
MTPMPAAMGGVFQEFFQEYNIVRAKWRQYKRLFTTSESIDLLNRHGAHAFGLIADLLIKDVIMCITRMMNPSKASWGDPANLATLLINLAAHRQVALVKRLTEIRDRVKPASDSLKRWRDEQLSKNDYAAYVGMKANIDAVPANDRKMIEDVLSAMSDVLVELQAHYSSVAGLKEDVAQPGDFAELVDHLRELERLRAKSSD